MPNTALLAIDWGTTTARVYRLDANGQVLDQRSQPLGISQVSEGRYAEALERLLGNWVHEPVPRLACGMIGSRQGWVEAPYVECPASLDTLASRLVHTPDGSLTIVPGLMTRDARGIPDVMRGEETQLLGAVAPDESQILTVLPGTHSKWALVDRGTVVDFATYMTGELYSVLLAHSILGRMAKPSAASNDAAFADVSFDRGVQHGLDMGGLTHDLFAARTLALTGELEPTEVEAWLSGLLIGREVRDALAWAKQYQSSSQIRIIGEYVLSQRYRRALEAAGLVTQPSPAQAAGQGLWLIARQAGLVG
jgi:2-dehydro-3-deoxygalactonokinase